MPSTKQYGECRKKRSKHYLILTPTEATLALRALLHFRNKALTRGIVWFFLKDQETEHRFVEELNQLGAKYLNGAQVTAENCSPIMAVHPDLKVAHLMIMIWNASFSPSFDQHNVGDASKS